MPFTVILTTVNKAGVYIRAYNVSTLENRLENSHISI
jgi:hypothetical protein